MPTPQPPSERRSAVDPPLSGGITTPLSALEAHPMARRMLSTRSMTDQLPGISPAFEVFLKEAPAHATAWMQGVKGLGSASSLDEKTEHLAYLAVLAALRLESGVPFHVQLAKQAGASRDEVVSAILVGLPAAGNAVTQSLPNALAAYDAG